MRIRAEWLEQDELQRVLGLLQDAGYQAWTVGGCVRNTLMGVPVADVDIATDARPGHVMELAGAAGFRAVPTGIDHGTVTVVTDGAAFEITTFRKDVETDGRRAVVAFSDTLDEDAQRRDFTMNAIYADRDGQIADPVGGYADAGARRLRFIGDAHDRIREDALRSLRFFRFYAWYGDTDQGPDPDAVAAIAELTGLLDRLSRERVGAEMMKLLSAPDPAASLALMKHTGVLSHILPGADPDTMGVLVAFEGQLDLAPDPLRRLAALGGEDTAIYLRLSRREEAGLRLRREIAAGPEPAAQAAYRHGADAAIDGALVLAAGLGSPPPADLVAEAARGGAQIFPIAAADLIDRMQGPALGQCLNRLEARWLASDFTMTRDELLAIAAAHD